ncbi:MAG: tannase/feruloyl esterase family alpha/beta hydrolase [Alphaproteobacteria bacterium]|nr:tannase/feruloyl esterase family alpha/beta hydrolase [Alphaproteobacteria bacterium]
MRRVAVTCALAGSLLSAAASAQNSYSFLDSETSAVNYSLATVAPQLACKDMRQAGGRSVTILSADLIAASAATPEFCRVLGVIAPEIRFEVALPSTWNRRLYMRGNGGFAGEALDAPPRVAQRDDALRHGFAAAQTNTGHDAAAEPLASFAVSYQKEVDYAFRAVHETALVSKRIVRAYYERAAAYSYFDGCSTGGRQGLISAQRFPADFDGIAVGAPVLAFTDVMTWNLWNAKALAAAPLTIDKMSLVSDAVYRKCDAKDGAADGLIADPRTCGFDPADDLPKCTGDKDAPGCFTSGQISALKAIYGGVISNGKPYFPGQPVGAEKIGTDFATLRDKVSGWDAWLISQNGPSRQLLYGESFFKYMAFGKPDPAYDWHSFDFDKDPQRLSEIRRLLDATNPDLSEFKSRGGKIVHYAGWADTALTPLMTINYYEQVSTKMGASTGDFYRLFMVPGMFHCRGGFGTDRVDPLTALVNWVENGKAPESIVATRMEEGKLVRSRPLCPYPQTAQYAGSGSLDEAASFTCK